MEDFSEDPYAPQVEEWRRRRRTYMQGEQIHDQPASAGLRGQSAQASGVGEGQDEIYRPNYVKPRQNPLGAAGSWASGRRSVLGMVSRGFDARASADSYTNQTERQKYQDSLEEAKFRLEQRKFEQSGKPKPKDFSGDYEIADIVQRQPEEPDDSYLDRLKAARSRGGFEKPPPQAPQPAAEVQVLDWYAKNFNNPDPAVQAAVKIYRDSKDKTKEFAPGSGKEVKIDESGNAWIIDTATGTKRSVGSGFQKSGNGNPPKADRLTEADVQKKALDAGEDAYARSTETDPVARAKASADASANVQSLGLPKTLHNADRFPTDPPVNSGGTATPQKKPGAPPALKPLTKKQFSPSTGKTRTVVSMDGGRTWQPQQ